MLTGKLILRNPGASGLGREVLLALHPACLEKQTKNAPGATRARRARANLCGARAASSTRGEGGRSRCPSSAQELRRGAVLSVEPSQGGRAPW